MKHLIQLLFLLLSLFLLGCDSRDARVLHDSQGQVIRLSAMKGKWVVINYWATWCHACMSEIPELNAFNRGAKSKNTLVLGANYDLLQGKALQDAVEKAKIIYPVPQEDLSRYFALQVVDVVPTTFILNPKGQLVKSLLGPQTEDGLLKVLDQLRSQSS